jgi:hypothetical protein
MDVTSDGDVGPLPKVAHLPGVWLGHLSSLSVVPVDLLAGVHGVGG